jgi:hypothetical protein
MVVIAKRPKLVDDNKQMSKMRANVPHSYTNEIDKNPNTFVGSKGATDSSSDLNRAT